MNGAKHYWNDSFLASSSRNSFNELITYAQTKSMYIK